MMISERTPLQETIEQETQWFKRVWGTSGTGRDGKF